MNNYYKALKKDLQDYYEKYFRVYKHSLITFPSDNRIPIKIWCYRVIDLLPIIKHSALSPSNLEEAFSYYSQLLSCLSTTKPIKELENLIKSIEKLIIRCLVAPLDILEEIFNEVYEEKVVQCKDCHDKYSLISITLYYLIDSEDYISNFDEFWENSLKKLFETCFGIENNEFMKDYSKEILFDPESHQHMKVDKAKIHVLLDNIFQTSESFKYFLKASKIFAEFKGFPIIEDQDMTTANLKIKILEHPSLANGFKNKEYKISLNDDTPGHKSRYFTIGSNKLANIQLTKAKYDIDSICFAIYYTGKNFLVIDCSKYNYSEIKMKPWDCFKIEKDYLIELALTGILRVVNYKIIYSPANDRNELELVYEYITGPLSLNYSDCKQENIRQKKVKTHKKKTDPDKIIFGRGGKGFDIDEFSDLLGLTGKRHICFYLNGDEEFCASDMKSKNGSHLLLKNHKEASDLKWSKVFPLFRNFKGFNSTEKLEPEIYKEEYAICQYNFEFEAEKISG